MRQIHSDIVNDVACPAPEGDALISNQPGVLVAVKTADCVPILLADPVTHSVAAVHAGWRGTAAEILSATLRQMSEKWGTRPADVHAAIGPAIGGCCYEVGADVAQRFAELIPELREHRCTSARSICRASTKFNCANRVSVISGDRQNVLFARRNVSFSFRRDHEQADRMFSVHRHSPEFPSPENTSVGASETEPGKNFKT